MLYFENDYSEGAHEKVLEALIKTNYEKLSGYGSDEYCKNANSVYRCVFILMLYKTGLATIGVCVLCAYFGRRIFIFRRKNNEKKHTRDN